MPRVSIDSIQQGDVLAENLFYDNVYLFGEGTILTDKRIEIIKGLGMPSILVEKRKRSYGSIEEILPNIEKRFSYVDGIPLMMHLKSWMKDIITNSAQED